jgi:cytochrome c-type biogenesis protein CcmH/NrfG
VEVSLILGKFNDALAAAKCAVKLRPASAQCFALLGTVIMKSNSANGRKEVLTSLPLT